MTNDTSKRWTEQQVYISICTRHHRTTKPYPEPPGPETGFSLTETHTKAVYALKAGEIPDPDEPEIASIEIDFSIPAVIPDDYVYDVHLRLILYIGIASAKSSAELDELKDEFIDRFGLLPEATKNCARSPNPACSPNRSASKQSTPTTAERGGCSAKNEYQPAKLIELIQTSPKLHKFYVNDTLILTTEMRPDGTRVCRKTGLLQALSGQQQAA